MLGSGFILALTSSLCCIAPVLAIISGTGSTVAAFSWAAPLRPYLLGATVLVLGYAFYRAYRRPQTDGCGCGEKESPLRSKLLLWVVAGTSVALSAYPYYAKYFQQMSTFYAKDISVVGTANKSGLSFYDVPLVCHAAPEIGCGSLTKPLFMAAQQVKEIKGIWLNRPGTRIAIKWDKIDDSAAQEKIIQPLFASYRVNASLIRDTRLVRALSDSLMLKGEWYKGLEIDQLSLEEAGVIAEDMVQPAMANGLLTADAAGKIKEDITAYFKTDLVKVRTCDELSSEATQVQWKNAVTAIFNKYTNPENSREAYILYEQKQKKENCSETDDCCKKR